MRWLAGLCLSLLLCLQASAQLTVTGVGGGFGVSGGSTGSCSQSIAFFARTNATHTSGDSLDTLICTGLVTNGFWNNADIIYVLAQPNSHDALLNLKSTSFTATVNGSPTFTANQGYVGATSANLDTNWQAGRDGVQYTQNNMGAVIWTLSQFSGGTDYGAAFAENTTTVALAMYPHFSDNNFYGYAQGLVVGFWGTPAGNYWWGLGRASNLVEQFFSSSSSLGPNNTSSTPQNIDLLLLNDGGPSDDHFNGKLAFVWVGADIHTTQATLCHSVNVYMTAVASAPGGVC